MHFAPIFFERNRVRRVYTGGKLFHDFFGDAAEDGFFPEEWIASSVRALNKDPISPKEGISKIAEAELYFDELIRTYPAEMLGETGTMRILVKILDSAVRLPAQAHPDKAFSRKHFQSEYGKTECWIILATRPGARIYFGFKDGVNREVFSAAVDASEADRDAMERLMESFTPKVGEVYLVPAKAVHAIGAGCLILEVQEPTDFTIQPEHWCDQYKLNAQEMYIGLCKNDAFDCFEFKKATNAKRNPKVIQESKSTRIERLIGEGDTDCFIINRITLQSGEHRIQVPGSYGVYILTEGEGRLLGEGYERAVKKGDYFFMPACAMGKYSILGSLSLIECY